MLHIAMYHYTRDLKNSRYPGIKGLDVELFKKQLEFFAANFSVVTMEQVIAATSSNTSISSSAATRERERERERENSFRIMLCF